MNKIKMIPIFWGVAISIFFLFINSFLFYPLFSYSLLLPFFLFVIFYNVFENYEKNGGYFVALILGFWLDVFSVFPVGFYTLTLFTSAFLIKSIFGRYVKISIF